jgi:poly [ADP-ribose] polymerase
MDNPKYAYLVCVDGRNNNNKFYEMKQVDNYNFVAAYGREGVTRTEHTYPMGRWQGVYNKRVNKRHGKSYDDVTHLKTVDITPVDDDVDADLTDLIDDIKVRGLVSRLQAFAKGSISRNYEISSQDVTQAMLDRAEEVLSQLSGLLYASTLQVSNSDVNDYLEQLYIAVPRRMANVRDHLLDFGNQLDIQEAKALYNLEQANIDVMSGQVRAGTRAKAPAKKQADKRNVLDDMGVIMRMATAEEVRKVKALGDASKIGTVFAVENKETQTAFNARMAAMDVLGGNHLRTAMYWHGSRNENWLNIVDLGLRIRPPGVASTGAMFGLGIYFADLFDKSLNYTSYRGSYYAQGSQDTGFMALYEVQIGNQYEIGRHSNSYYDLNSASLEKRGYDSVWGKSGYSLINNEYVIFLASQCTVTYLVQLR